MFAQEGVGPGLVVDVVTDAGKKAGLHLEKRRKNMEDATVYRHSTGGVPRSTAGWVGEGWQTFDF